MKIQWKDWNRFSIFMIVVIVVTASITFFSADKVEARTTLQEGYQVSSNNVCHVLSPEDTASYISEELSEMTGKAVSPLLGMTVIGWFRNLCTEEQYKPLLPWYYQANFLKFSLVSLLILTLKDTLLAPLGPLKKPLDALGEIVHGISGLVALPTTVIYFADSLSHPIAENLTSLSNWILPSAYAAGGSLSHPLSGSFLLFGQTFGVAIGLLLFSSIWLLGNIIEILIFLCPIPFGDTVLVGIRSTIISTILFLTYMNPILGGILALVILVFSLGIFGWSFRLLTYGMVYCGDFIRRKLRTRKIDKEGVLAFSGKNIPRLKSCILGRIHAEEKGIVFTYYPYLVLPKKRIPISTQLTDGSEINVVSGLLTPSLVQVNSLSDSLLQLFDLPPRYRSREHSVANYLNLTVNQDLKVNRKGGGWWRSLLP
ncbi:MAG: hypothetical protein SAJ37_22050 [Oscillatoria sp. PMC 1068.18]|nr:hypothetical protein [Oscillatoria sp. PMC 1068.18]